MIRSLARHQARVSRVAVVALASVAVVAGITLVVDGARSPKPPPQPSLAQSFTVQPTSTPTPAPPKPAAPTVAVILALKPATPTRVHIPSIRVDAPLIGLALDANRHLATPPERDRNLAGWFQNGAVPGMIGTALIDGHVDNFNGPAVFYNLGALHKGDAISVDRADHVAADFTVDAVEAYDAHNYPDQKVYGWATRAELRLITCGAGFDKRSQHYLGNVVVYAHLVGSHQI